jgi:hypothetical protein
MCFQVSVFLLNLTENTESVRSVTGAGSVALLFESSMLPNSAGFIKTTF